MTITEVNERIKNIIEDYGFVPVMDDKCSPVYGVKRNREDYVSFKSSCMVDESQTDWNLGKVVYKVLFSADICKMGGSSTPDELIEAANQIRKGALMVKKINKLALSFTA
jgi:hypothetical protein